MSGTQIGGFRAGRTNRNNDPDFYKKIGKIGGAKKTTLPKGFAAIPGLAKIAGTMGGKNHRNTMAKTTCLKCKKVYSEGSQMFDELNRDDLTYLGLQLKLYRTRQSYVSMLRHKVLAHHRTHRHYA